MSERTPTNGDGHAGEDIEVFVAEHVPESAAFVTTEASGGHHEPAWRRILRESRNWKELRGTPYGVKPVALVGSVYFLTYLESAVFSFGGPEIARDLGINIGYIISILVATGVVLVPVTVLAGWYGDRHRRVPMLGVGTIFTGVFSMLSAGAWSGLSLAVPRVLDESATTIGDVPSYALVSDYYPPEQRGKVFAIIGIAFRIARLIAPLVVGATLVHFGWRPMTVAFGAPLIVLGIVLLLTLREPVRGYMERRAMGADHAASLTEDEPQSFGEGWRTVWAVRTLRRGFVADIFSATSVIFSVFFTFFLAEKHGLDAFQRGLVFTPAVLAALVGNYLGGGLVDSLTRRNPGRVLTVRGILEAAAAFTLLGLFFQPPLWVVVALNAVNSFGLTLTGPAANVVYSQVIPPQVRTQGLQVFNFASLPTSIIFFPIAGQIFGKYGYPSLFLALFPMALIGAIIAATAGQFFDVDRRNAMAQAIASDEWRRARAAGRGKLLVCRSVDVEYDGVQVLFGVDFDVEEGEIIALLGTNGAGKSTLLRAISGTQEASGGAVVFDGRDITHMPPHEIAGRGVVSMPGGRGIFPGLSVAENLMLGNWTSDEEHARARLAEVFEIFPILKTRATELAGVLSGGEQQMLSLAQAFLSSPRLLMIDELSLGLSPAVVAQLLDIVREIHRRGTTIIVVEQSVNVALTIAEKAIFMEKGEVKFAGRTADLLARPDILRAVYVKGTGALTDAPTGSALRREADRRALELGTARSVLEVESIVKRFGGVTAINGVSFALREGEVLGLIGPNGSGKTTLFDVISGFQVPDEGVVRYDGVDITAMAPEERARKKLVRRFQDARLFPSLTVFETLLVALDQRAEVRSTVLNALQLPGARRAERRLRVRAERLVELLELGAYRDKFVKELSTGLRRILDLACVLATEPHVLLLDEPSSGIAQAEAEALGPLLNRVRYETACSILIIEHDMPLISAVSDELIALQQGTVVTRGLPADVLNDERVIQSYLGTSEEAVKRSGSLI